MEGAPNHRYNEENIKSTGYQNTVLQSDLNLHPPSGSRGPLGNPVTSGNTTSMTDIKLHDDTGGLVHAQSQRHYQSPAVRNMSGSTELVQTGELAERTESKLALRGLMEMWSKQFSRRGITTKILKWDVTTTDKLMYILLPLLLFESAFILMFIMSPLDPPTLTMHCWPPAEFSGAWVKYVNSECLRKSKSGQSYTTMGDTIPDHNERPEFYDVTGEFNQTAYPSPPVPAMLYVMAMLAVIPFGLWRYCGVADGTELITSDSKRAKKPQTGIKYKFLQLESDRRHGYVFVGTKLLAVGISFLMVIMISTATALARQYVTKSEEYKTPKGAAVLCDFRIRRLGENIHNYTIQCMLSSQRDPLSLLRALLDVDYVIIPLLSAVTALIVIVLVIQALNALIITAIYIKSHNKAFRQFIIDRYAGDQDVKVAEIMYERIGKLGVFVTAMSVRCGESQRINEIYKSLAEEVKLELDKAE